LVATFDFCQSARIPHLPASPGVNFTGLLRKVACVVAVAREPERESVKISVRKLTIRSKSTDAPIRAAGRLKYSPTQAVSIALTRS
jgi:hypothetical protein